MKPKILLISNMYPSKKYPVYGIFVKIFLDNLSSSFDFTKIVIEGRKEHKLKKIVIYVFFFSSIFYNALLKKMTTSMYTMHTLKKDISNFQILIAGRGIEEKALLNDIAVFVGEKTHFELVDIYSALDIFVFPTMLEESLGLVGLEAMACGVPVVGSNIGGLTDYIKNDYNGYLFEVGDSDSLVSMISKCKFKQLLNLSEI